MHEESGGMMDLGMALEGVVIIAGTFEDIFEWLDACDEMGMNSTWEAFGSFGKAMSFVYSTDAPIS